MPDMKGEIVSGSSGVTGPMGVPEACQGLAERCGLRGGGGEVVQ